MEIKRVASQWHDDYVLYNTAGLEVARIVCTRWRNWWPLGVMRLPLRPQPFTTLEAALDFLYQLADDFVKYEVPPDMADTIMQAAARGAQRTT